MHFRRSATGAALGAIFLCLVFCDSGAEAGVKQWWDDFEDGDWSCWDIVQNGGTTVAVEDTLGNSGNRSLRIWSSDTFGGSGAYCRSRTIPIDFSQDYTVRFAFRYESFHWDRFLVFGHIRLLLDYPDLPMLYDPVGDNSFPGNQVSTRQFESYLPSEEWGWVTVHCRPGDRLYDVFINGTQVGSVSYQATVTPSDSLWFEDNHSGANHLNGWFDDFSIYGMTDSRKATYARPGHPTDPENDCTSWVHPPDVPFHGQYPSPPVRPGLGELCAPPPPNGRCLVACLQMVFDRFGDNLPQPSANPVNPGAQEEIEAAANTNDRDGFPNGLWNGTYQSDIRRAGHFSTATTANTAIKIACPPSGPYGAQGAAGYSWRDLGYSVVDSIWTDLAPEDQDSVDAGRPPFVLESFIASGYPILALFDPGENYADSLADDEYDGEKDTTTISPPESTVVGHVVVIIGYDNVGGQGHNPRMTPSLLVHDPAGAKYQWIPIDEFWNNQWNNKRFVFAAPWELMWLSPPEWKYQCRFNGTMLATYTGPDPLDGRHPVANAKGKVTLGHLAFQDAEIQTHNMNGISTTGDWDYSTWKLVGGPKPSGLIVIAGSVGYSAWGTLSPAANSISYGAYADRLGGSGSEWKWMSAAGCLKLVDPGHGGWPYGGRWGGKGPGGSGIIQWGLGSPNRDLFVFVRNLGETPVPAGATCNLFYGDPTLAPRSPGDIYIGSVPVPPLTQGDTLTIGPVPWTPPPANGYGEPNFALFSTIDCPGDSSDSDWPQGENNHAALSEFDFDAVRGLPVSMRFGGENPEPTAMEILLEVEKEGPAEDWVVLLDQPVGTPIPLAPLAAIPVQATVTVPPGDADTSGSVHIDCYLYVPGGDLVRMTGSVTMTLHLPVNTKVEEGSDAPPPFLLAPNAPNPFNPVTTLRYSIPLDGLVTLRVYDLSGRLVRTIFSGSRRAGWHEAVWRGETDRGGAAASGVYFVRLVHEGRSKSTRKVVLVR